MATEGVAKAGFPGIWIHGKSMLEPGWENIQNMYQICPKKYAKKK